MPPFDLLASSWLGSLVGIRHALEPDHVAAVTTLLDRERSPWRAILLGAWWGVGHTLTLVAAGLVLVMLRIEMPPRLAVGFELVVALMLIALGLRSIREALRHGSEGPDVTHRHGSVVHHHSSAAAHVHLGGWTLARRPLIIGAVHGLAGSGTLMALVFATLPSARARIAYVLLFGLGSTVSMAALSGALGWPLAKLGQHAPMAKTMSIAVGAVSTAIGIAWGFAAWGRL
jgi:hypothetical protein